VTRRIDDIGRIAIPKEFRNELNIKEGELLDIEIKGTDIIIRRSVEANRKE
jgi:AbrB family looped-hinge helix DNA binding protein